MARYDNVEVQLTGIDGNVFMIIGTVQKAIRAGVSAEAAKEFAEEAMDQESYEDVLDLVSETVVVY